LCGLLTACGFQTTVAPGGDGVAIDDAAILDTAVADAPQDPACAALWMYTASNFDPCEMSHVIHPALTLATGDYTFAPASGELRLNNAAFMTLPTTGTSPAVLSLAGLTIGVGATLRISGGTPLIIAVHSSALIDGTLSASAVARQSGPGGGMCVAGKGGDGAAAPANWTAGGGGGGGGFGSSGATGGTGDVEPGHAKTPGGTPIAANADTLLVPLRAGCAGGPGGEEDPSCTSPGTPGAGGGGGGAVQLSVRNSLTLTAAARVSANGGGGGRGANGTYAGGSHVGVGGGGGGSGGAIFLEGMTITIAAAARLCANGGGGGGGSHNNDGPATDGADGACAGLAAVGGTGFDASGGNGAFGSTAAVVGEAGSRQDDGGGGGGGGVGRIRVRAATGAAPAGFTSTPAAVIN